MDVVSHLPFLSFFVQRKQIPSLFLEAVRRDEREGEKEVLEGRGHICRVKAFETVVYIGNCIGHHILRIKAFETMVDIGDRR